MDSGNSGSLQSSSGGDDEYDSRAADSVPSFMPISNSTPPPPPQFFDPLSNYLHLHQNPNFNSGLAWPGTSATPPRSGPNPVTHDKLVLPTSSSFMPPFQPPGVAGGASAVAPPLDAAPPSRNPKKRSRASRRAPTTVLTTDTTNFRAMVQEFTGIPSPPFSNSSFPRSRLDLLSAAQPPPYLRRPFPQKAQPHHSLFTSPTLDAIAASSPTSAAAVSGSPSSLNYQSPINSNLFNAQNPLLSSLLQSNPNPKFPFSTPSNSFDFPSNIPNLIQNDTVENNNGARWNDNHVTGDGNRIDRAHLRSVNGDYSKMNFPTTSTSNFHGGKPPGNDAVRGEGMVESWICSSE